ncbi:MAG: peroxide stress protein YaaA [Burkholderiaceae bacterium]|jgi:cytoplasmic iron level regulating protein YaaA (DUF328/UPF0246 family)
MLMVLSPAKALDFERPSPNLAITVPQFEAEAALLVKRLKRLSPADIGRLMSLSESLAHLNADRFSQWESGVVTPPEARHAILAFNGDVYEGLNAQTLKKAQLQWAQEHLCILSGLYGALRPLDALQPYRLEMGTRLATDRGSDLYAFWGHRVTNAINDRLHTLQAKREPSVLLNLASQEYAKVLRFKPGAQTASDPGGPGLQAEQVVSPVFEDEQPDGGYKVVSFFAKRARGLMARFVIEQRILKAADLSGFDLEGYRWMKAISTLERPVFRRRRAAE